MARHLTRIDSELFDAIEPEEFLVKLWGLGSSVSPLTTLPSYGSSQMDDDALADEISKHLTACVDRFNQVGTKKLQEKIKEQKKQDKIERESESERERERDGKT